MSNAKSIAKNVASLYIGEILSQVLTFFLVIAIAHYLGDAGLGKYSFAFSFAALFLILADMGLPTLITKEVAKDRILTNLHLTKTFTLKLILNAVAFTITIAAIAISRKDYETIFLVALAGVAMFFYNLAGMYRAIFQAYEVMKYEASSRIIERVIAAGIGIFLLYRGFGIISLFIILIFSNMAYYFVLYMLVKIKISKVSLIIDKEAWKRSLKESMPFWITTVFISLYFRIDTILLGFMKGFTATGWYNAGLKIIEVVTRIPFLLIVAVFPTLAKFHKLSYDKTKLLYKRSFQYMMMLSLPIATGLFLLADRIILNMYSPEFNNSVIVLQILAASLIFVFVNYLMGYLLNSIDKQKLFTLTAGVTTIFNVLLNIVLIPKYSYIGAAVATLISEVLNFCMLYYFTFKNKFGINLVKVIGKPVLATSVMIGLMIYLKNFHLFLIISISAIIYFIVLFVVRGIGQEEINILKSIISRK